MPASFSRWIAVVIFLIAIPGLSASDIWTGEYDFDETYVGNATVSRGAKRVVDFDESDTFVHFALTPRVALGVLRLGAEYQQFSFGFEESAILPNTLQSVAALIGFDTQIKNSILLRVEAMPGVYSEAFRPGSNDFNMPFTIGGTYIVSPDLQLALGIGVDIDRKYPVLPGGGIRWRFQPHWVFNAILPEPRLEYEASKSVTLYVGANLKETNFRVSDTFGTDHGKPKLNHAVLTYSEVRTGTGLDWKITNWLSLNAEAGYQPYRVFDFYRADFKFDQDSSAPYGTISFHGAF